MFKAEIRQDGELVAVIPMSYRGFPDSSEGYFGEVNVNIYGEIYQFQAQAIKLGESHGSRESMEGA